MSAEVGVERLRDVLHGPDALAPGAPLWGVLAKHGNALDAVAKRYVCDHVAHRLRVEVAERAPSAARWVWLCEVVSRLPRLGLSEGVVAQLEGALRAWPDRARVAPQAWLTRSSGVTRGRERSWVGCDLPMTAGDPRMRLVRALRVHRLVLGASDRSRLRVYGAWYRAAQVRVLELSACRLRRRAGEVLALDDARLDALILSRCEVGSADALCGLLGLPAFGALKTLEMERTLIARGEWRVFVRERWPDSVEHVALRKMQVSFEAFEDWVRFQDHLRLRSLDLSFNRVQDAGVDRLVEASMAQGLERLKLRSTGLRGAALARLGKLRHMTALSVRGNRLGDGGLEALARSGLRLKELVAADCGMHEGGFRAALEVCDARSMERLNVRSNALGDRGLFALTERGAWPALKLLNVRSCGVSGRGLARFLERLEAPELRWLMVRGNPLGDEGVRALAQWPGVSALTEIDLTGSGCTIAGIHALLSSPHLGPLRRLSLRQTACDASVIERLDSDPRLRGLEALDVRATELGDAGAEALWDSALMRRLRALDVSDNGITAQAAAGLGRVAASTRLERVDVSRNALSASQWAELLDGSPVSEAGCVSVGRGRRLGG